MLGLWGNCARQVEVGGQKVNRSFDSFTKEYVVAMDEGERGTRSIHPGRKRMRNDRVYRVRQADPTRLVLGFNAKPVSN